MGLHPKPDLDFSLAPPGDTMAQDIITAAQGEGGQDPATLLLAILERMNDRLDQLSDKAFVVTSAFVEMPPDGIPFDELAWTALPDGDPEGLTYTVLQFVVPTGNNGVIKWKGNVYLGPEFVEGTGKVVWQILADGQPITNYENILGSLGSTSSPTETAPLRIYESQTIAVILINNGIVPAGQGLGARLSGWFYPTAYDEKKPITEEPDDE
jgi:hypothetical protein